MQHRAIIDKLKIKLKSDYYKTKQTDNCPYDIKKYREEPMKANNDISKIKWRENGLNNVWGTISK